MTSEDEARKEFEAVVEEYKEDAGLDRLKGLSVDIFSKIVKDAKGKPAKNVGGKVTNAEALAGCDAAVAVYCALVEKSTDYREILGYTAILREIRKEAATLRSKKLMDGAAAYKPFNKTFAKAADSLKAALKLAQDQAKYLNLAADVLSVFARLLTVL